MSIRFACPECNKRLETVEKNAGRSITCPRCGLTLIIPDAQAPIGPGGLRKARVAPSEPPLELEQVAELPPPPSRPRAAPPVEPVRTPLAPPLPSEVESSTPPAAPPRRAVPSPEPPEPAVATAVAAPPAPSTRPPDSEGPLFTASPKIDFEDLIDMTAMVDIVFFLLIFFLVTSMHALDSTIPIPTPDPQGATGSRGSSSAAEPDDSSITVNIDRNDVIRIDGAEVTPKALLFKLKDLRNGPGRPDKLLVIGHSDATHGTTVLVLDAGHEVGMESVRLAVRDETD